MFGRNTKIKYFAYGSNINLEQMRRRLGWLGQIEPGEPYILENWELKFNVGFDFGVSRYANIEYSKGKKVYGLIYTITQRQLDQLSMFEGFYSKVSFRHHVNKEKIFTFIAKYDCRVTEKRLKKPSLEYINTILQGCIDARLDYLYAYLVDYKNKNYKLKKGNKFKQYGSDNIS